MFEIDTVLNNYDMVKEFLKHGSLCHLNSNYSPKQKKKHVSSCRRVSEYKGDIVLVDKDETQHSTAVGQASIDGAGLTRAYNQHIRGVQSIFMISLLTNKPIYLIHTQVFCNQCTTRFNKAIEVFGIDTVINNDVMVKEFLKHGGVCHRNSKYSPAVAKEYCAAEVWKRLLLNEEYQYVGDDISIFVDILFAEKDTRSPKKFIHIQHQIIWTTA